MRVSSRVCSVPDFLVVGGGSAGSLLARRLAQHHTSGKVLLLEAGARPPLWTRVPIAYLRSIGNPSVDWCFFTEPEPGLNGRRLRYPRGRVLGGCSVINGKKRPLETHPKNATHLLAILLQSMEGFFPHFFFFFFCFFMF